MATDKYSSFTLFGTSWPGSRLDQWQLILD